jgi:hypothetical protein
MSMPFVTRVVGFFLILLGIVGYLGTGRSSITAMIPAFFGAIFLVLALVARKPDARRHAMHAAVALALIGALAVIPRIVSGISAGNLTRPAVLSQIAMAIALVVYVALGVRSFIEARRARKGS